MQPVLCEPRSTCNQYYVGLEAHATGTVCAMKHMQPILCGSRSTCKQYCVGLEAHGTSTVGGSLEAHGTSTVWV